MNKQKISPATRRAFARLGMTLLWLWVSGLMVSPVYAQQNFGPPGNPIVTAVSGNPEVDAVITVSVANLQQWSTFPDEDPWKLVPYLNGLPVDATYPVSVDFSRGRLAYHLRINEKNSTTWKDLLAPPVLTRPISLSVGLERGAIFPTKLDEEHPATLVVVEPKWAIVAVILVCSTTALCLWLGSTTGICRDSGRPPPFPGAKQPLSLAKVQMGFWFLLIFNCYLWLWITTGEEDTLNSSIPILLGISAGTAFGDNLITRSLANRAFASPANSPAAATAMCSSLAPLVSPQNGVASAAASPAGAVTDTVGVMQGAVATPISASPTFLERGTSTLFQLISDERGVTFHRLQMLAWTVALGFIFLSDVYYDLAMPHISSNLLSLMGLSTGTYLGFRVPEVTQQPDATLHT